ncbi:MAG: DNA topoisomerase IA, partial [Harvfovirus sp.]
VGKAVLVSKIVAVQEYQRPKPRYNEASLVNKLDPKNLNIGRPSTTGAIINKIQERSYVKMGNVAGSEKDAVSLSWMVEGDGIERTSKKVIIGKETGRLIPTDLGIRVTNFLIESFPDIMDYKFTAKMESDLDRVAEGNADWVTVLDDFYKKFHPIIENLKAQEAPLIRKDEKYLGDHPVSGQKIYASLGKYGAMVKMAPEKGKAIIAPIKEPLKLDTITLEDAVKIFEYPKNLGKYGRKQVIVKRGMYGLYIVCGDQSINLQGDAGENITLEGAIELIKEKESAIFFEGKEGNNSYSVLRGKYGVYVKFDNGKKKSNLKISQDVDVENLTLEIVKAAIKQGKKKFGKDVAPVAAKKGADDDDDKSVAKKAPAKKAKKAPAKKPKKTPKKILVKGKKPKVVNLFELT